MKNFTTSSLAALAALAFFTSSCDKESNSVAPSPLVTSKSEDANPTIKNGYYGGIAPCPLNGIWNQGTPATGIYDDNGNETSIPMRLVNIQGTGIGEFNTYVTLTPIPWTANYGKTYTIEYTNNTFSPYDPTTNTYGAPVSVNQKCVTAIDMEGNVNMKVTLNLKK